VSWDLDTQSADLRAQGLWRDLRLLDGVKGPIVQVDSQQLINFSSNDYLGLAASSELKEALKEGVSLYGAGSGASRLVSGTQRPHLQLEEALAEFKKTQAALTFSSGYAAALGTIPGLLGPSDTIILDKLSHACLVDAARLSGATIRVFPHNHVEKLERLLATAKGRVLIVTEAIFSMDGDACALLQIVSLKERYGAWLLLDEAHSVGVLGPQGRGLAAALGLENQVELHMGTLSKSFGLSGGYLAASRQVIDLLINRARSLIYSTAPAPALAYAAVHALAVLSGQDGDLRRDRLWSYLAILQPQPPPASAILPKVIGDENEALKVSVDLKTRGFLIPAIRYPTVSRGSARLRITCTAGHSQGQIEQLKAELDAVDEFK
jgi:8-amino-7-oxononanoate synthase